MWPESVLRISLSLPLPLIQTIWTARGTGVTGRRAASPVEMATRREPGHVATPARPPSPEPVICPAAQVKTLDSRTKRFHTSKDGVTG